MCQPIINAVTTGNGHRLKWHGLFNIQSSAYGTTTVAKVSLFSTRTRSTVSFCFVQKSRNRPKLL